MGSYDEYQKKNKDVSGANYARTITFASGVNVNFFGETVYYNLSGITRYKDNNVLKFNNVFYSGSGENVKLIYNGEMPEDHHAEFTVIDDNANSVAVNKNGEFKMPAANVTVTSVSIVKDEMSDVVISNNITNGIVTSDKSAAGNGKTVTLTVTPNEGYVLTSIKVTNNEGTLLSPESDATITQQWGGRKYFALDENGSRTFTFTQGLSASKVEASFVKLADLLTVTLPKTGQTNIKIPIEYNAFKLSSSGNSSCDGYLCLTAPEGFLINIKGKIKMDAAEGHSAIFYDGADILSTAYEYKFTANATSTSYQYYDVNFTSSGNSLLFYEYLNNKISGSSKAFDEVTATLIPINYTISYCGIENASFVSSNPETYTIEDEITLVNPTKEGYSFWGWMYDGQTEPVETVTIAKGNTGDKVFSANWKQELGALTLYYHSDGKITAEIQGDFINTTSEDKPLVISEPKTVDKVIFKRSFAKGIPATIMLPFGFTPDGDNIGSFYTLKSVECKNGEWIATMSNPVTYVTANTPYIFKAAKNLTELSFEDEVGITLQPTSDIKENPNGDWTLHGVYAYTLLYGNDQINYGFAGREADGIKVGDFIRAGDGVWADPMRCYLTYSGEDTRLKTKAATVLPDRIRVVFPDEVEDEPSDTEIITPVTEITKESGVKVWSYNKLIIIESQPDTDYSIVDLSGRILKTGVTHSTHEEVTVNLSTGIVIVIINDKSFKLNY